MQAKPVSKTLTVMVLILSFTIPTTSFSEEPNSRDGLSWYEFYSIAVVDWIAKLPQHLRESWLSNSNSPERVVTSVVTAVRNRNSVEFNRLTGDPETGVFGSFNKTDLETLREGPYSVGKATKISDDKITLVQYRFDQNIATCLKLEKFEVPLVPQGKALVKCYSEYKIYRATGKSETTLPYFQTKAQSCPDMNGTFENRQCQVVNLNFPPSQQIQEKVIEPAPEDGTRIQK